MGLSPQHPLYSPPPVTPGSFPGSTLRTVDCGTVLRTAWIDERVWVAGLAGRWSEVYKAAWTNRTTSRKL